MPKNRCPLVAASTLLVALTSNVLAQDAVQWRVEDGGNGHWYQLVISETDSELAWSTAESAARATGGHLATVANEDENEFIFSVADQINAWWIVADNPIDYCIGPWLGGTDEAEEGTWSWVTGEEWDWTNWWTGEPNNGCNGEDYLSFLTQGDIVPSSNWNDGGGECGPWPKSYVVEWSADCNGDGIVDYGQILDGTLTDSDGNGIPDTCEIEFSGFEVVPSTNGDFTVLDIHAVYNSSDVTALNMFERSILTKDGQGFHHSDLSSVTEAPGSWSPLLSLDLPGTDVNSAIDSFVTLGGGVGTPEEIAANNTALDPGFEEGSGPLVPVGSGWYDGNPKTPEMVEAFAGGYHGLSGFSVFVGRFVVETARINDYSDPTSFFTFNGESGAEQTKNEDIFYGTGSVAFPDERDCDGNGTIDWIELTNGSAADCNGNFIPDACEIADGLLTDTDGDGIPDVCDPCPSWPGSCSEDGQTLFVVEGDSIQQAVDICPEDGTVSIGPGTFTGEGGSVITLPSSGINIVGSAGAENTIIDGENTRQGITGSGCGDNGTVIQGLTITRGTGQNGGGIFLFGCSPSFVQCTITANQSVQDGGGLYCRSRSNPIIDDCIISDNVATTQDGGGLIAWDNSSLTISNSLVSGNTCGDDGGGVFHGLGSTLTLTNSNLIGNTATNEGGGIYGTGATVLTDCFFSNNYASISGGAARLAQASITISNCQFDANECAFEEANPGGAIALNDSCTLNMDNSNFSGNIGFYGGAISSVGNSTLVATDCNFSNNRSWAGACIWALGASSIEVNACTFSENVADIDGGALNIRSGSILNVTSCVFADNNALEEVTSDQADEKGGGAIQLALGVSATIIESDFINNYTSASGGAICNAGSSLLLEACAFSGNVADVQAHAIANTLGGTTELTDSNVCSNGAMIDDIDGGHEHSIALLSTGQILCWGGNDHGQIDIPEGLADPDNPVVDIEAGSWHSIAVLADGTVRCWGRNNWGQSTPPASVTDGTNRVIQVEGGELFSLALLETGEVFGWGQNDNGEIDFPPALTDPVAPIRFLRGGVESSLAILENGELLAWGKNEFGECDLPEDIGSSGLGVVDASVTFHGVALLEDGSIRCWGRNNGGQCDIPSGIGEPGFRVSSVHASAFQTFVVLEDGSMTCWGSPSSPQGLPGPCPLPEELIFPGTAPKLVARGAYHGLAVREDGQLLAWGWNGYGQTDAPGALTHTDQISGIYTDLGGSCVTAVCDSDGDGTLDCFDGCPDDPDKTEPGPCGCAGSEIDTDGDGIPDCIDPCPTWPGDCSEDGQTLFVGSDDGADAIQLALEIIPEGGTISVGPGTYAGPIDFAGKAVTLEAKPDRQAGPAGEVILDGTGLDGSIVLAITGEGPDTILRGFVLQNGTTGSDPIAPSSWDYTVAGALYVHASSPTIENCVFRNCSAGTAGAAFLFASGSLISGCSFTDNVSGRNGGGLQLHTSEANIEDCVFTGNQANFLGGAVHNWKGSPSFIRCTITDNTAFTSGGGMSFFWNTTAEGNGIVEDCVITRNVAQVEGGGLMLTTETELTLDWLLVGNTTICNNTPENTNPNAGAPFVDLGGNQICGCPGDVNFDAQVDGQDLAELLSKWGVCTSDDPTACFADINGDGVVGGPDLTIILSSWGVCVN